MSVVVPRGYSPVSGDPLPLEDLVSPHLGRGAVAILGGPRSGKSTALRFLRARFEGVIVLDDPDADTARAAAEAGPLLYAAPSPLPLRHAASIRIAAWGMDECMEYLLAIRPDRCASVLERLARCGDLALAGGNPELLAFAVRAMATDGAVRSLRDAFRSAPEPLSRHPQVRLVREAAEILRRFDETGALPGVPRRALLEELLLLAPEGWLGRLPRERADAQPIVASLLHLAGAAEARRWSNLAGAWLAGVSWPGIELPGCDLREAHLRGADLSSARAERARFDYADLTGARLDGAALREASFRAASLGDADLRRADLRDADLADAPLRGVRLEGALLDGANLARARFVALVLPAARLAGASLRGAELTGASLPGSDLRRAILHGARAAGIDLEGSDLRDADLGGVEFHFGSSRSGLVGSPIAGEGSRTGFYTDPAEEQHFLAPEEIRKANLRACDLRGATLGETDFYLVDLRDARLDPEQREQLRRRGAILSSPRP